MRKSLSFSIVLNVLTESCHQSRDFARHFGLKILALIPRSWMHVLVGSKKWHQGYSRDNGSPQKLSKKVRELFYQHLCDQLSNGVALEAALSHFKSRMVRANRQREAKIINLIMQKLQNGRTFSQSLEGLVDAEDLALIAAGEMGGKLPFVLSLILEQHARAARLKKTLREGLSSSLGHLIIACGVLWYLASAVIPQLESAVPVSRAHGLVRALYALSSFVNSPAVLMIPIGAILLGGSLMWSLPRWTGQSRLVAERYFPYNYYRDLAGYQWLMVFTTLLSSGIADVTILQMQSKGASPYLRERLSLLFHRLRSGGMSLADALILPSKQGDLTMNFPSPDINESIIALYGFANFPQRIAKLVSQWAIQIEEKTLALAKSTSTFFEFVMMFGLTLLILAVQELANQVGAIG